MNGPPVPSASHADQALGSIKWLDERQLVRLRRRYALFVGAVLFAGALAVSLVLVLLATRSGGFSDSLGSHSLWIPAIVGSCALLGGAAIGTYALRRFFTISRVGIAESVTIFEHPYGRRLVSWPEFTGRVVGPTFLGSYAIELRPSSKPSRRRYEWVSEEAMMTIVSVGHSIPWKVHNKQEVPPDPSVGDESKPPS